MTDRRSSATPHLSAVPDPVESDETLEPVDPESVTPTGSPDGRADPAPIEEAAVAGRHSRLAVRDADRTGTRRGNREPARVAGGRSHRARRRRSWSAVVVWSRRHRLTRDDRRAVFDFDDTTARMAEAIGRYTLGTASGSIRSRSTTRGRSTSSRPTRRR